jgi:hypothetical protein
MPLDGGEPLLSAAELAGLLAEEDRLRTVAALVLGATTMSEVASAAGLEPRDAGRALARLVGAGLVVRDKLGDHFLVVEAFRQAARAAAPAERPDEHPDAPPDAARVLRAFVRDGRLLSIPAGKAKRQVVLDLLAQEFEPGRRYSERQVNAMLVRWHPDTAALRRYLVDDGFMEREAGEYWRAGGTFRP